MPTQHQEPQISALLNQGMNTRSSGFGQAPVGPPASNPSLGDARKSYSPTGALSVGELNSPRVAPQNWGARGAKPYPESATPRYRLLYD
ncbi:hypothetical protein BI334_05630 [Moorena producens 3L]|nr:hypothetical protein BI334_05630 [Moorena producens 3L]